LNRGEAKAKYKPESPTNVYMNRLKPDISPKMESTRLKLNNPIKPQFMAPMITKISERVSNPLSLLIILLNG
jgi:hypothetical protein